MRPVRTGVAVALAAASLLTTETEAEIVRYAYDAAGRLASVAYPERNAAIFYRYDAAGNLLLRTTGTADCDGQSLPCDDGDVCTIDTCDAQTGCMAQFVPGPTCAAPTPLCGDFNDDGNITATDALGVLGAAVGSLACDISVCDVDGNGIVTATDALAVLRTAVGLGGPLTCES